MEDISERLDVDRGEEERISWIENKLCIERKSFGCCGGNTSRRIKRREGAERLIRELEKFYQKGSRIYNSPN